MKFNFFQSTITSVPHSDHANLAASAALTTAGTTGTFVFSQLHISEIAMIVSCVCAICGVLINAFVAISSWRKQK
jgi:hypothetical protein